MSAPRSDASGKEATCPECRGRLPYGHDPNCRYLRVPNGILSMATVAAPMLGGFTITLAGVAAQADDKFAAPGISLLLLTLAAISLITCIQAGFWFQRPVDYNLIARWRNAARIFYNLGIILLFFALATVLAPKNSADTARWIAAGLAGAAGLTEIMWSLGARVRR